MTDISTTPNTTLRTVAGQQGTMGDPVLLAKVLRSRGRNNSLHDINRAADFLAACPQPALAVKGLQDFAKWAIREGAFQAADLDGLSIQEKAQELGLIAPTLYDPSKHGPSDCAEPGDEWFVFTDALVAPPPSGAVEAAAGTRLFILAVSLSKSAPHGLVHNIMQGYRRSANEDEARGSFIAAVGIEKPDFAIEQMICLEVPELSIAPATADGWRLVPVNPTPEMLGAWYRYKNGHHWPDQPVPRDTSDVGAYAAMIAAAPTATGGR